MPLKTRLTEGDELPGPGYEMVWMNGRQQWWHTHHLADLYNLVTGVYGRKTGNARHHADFNKRNNDPRNIKRMPWRAHTNSTRNWPETWRAAYGKIRHSESGSCNSLVSRRFFNGRTPRIVNTCESASGCSDRMRPSTKNSCKRFRIGSRAYQPRNMTPTASARGCSWRRIGPILSTDLNNQSARGSSTPSTRRRSWHDGKRRLTNGKMSNCASGGRRKPKNSGAMKPIGSAT